MAKKQPPFKTETQEAEWWAKNQNLIADRFEQAKAAANWLQRKRRQCFAAQATVCRVGPGNFIPSLSQIRT